MSEPKIIPHPLSIDLRNTTECRAIAVPICEFENSVFGPDFAYPPESLVDWFDSGCLFCAAICGEAVAGRTRVLSVTSALLTFEASRDRMLRGEITDSELTPWTEAPPRAEPSIYFASVISDNSAHLSCMYQSLGFDLESFFERAQLEPRSAFSVASGKAGFTHMERNGFRAAGLPRYLERYEMMTLDYLSARTNFWQRLLCPASLRHRHPSPLAPDSVPSALSLASEPNRAEAHEVEKRLIESKTERYRNKNPTQSF